MTTVGIWILDWSGIQMVKSCPIAKWSVIWIPDRFSNSGLNTELPFEYQTSEYPTSGSSLFKCFRYSGVCYSDPHCTYLNVEAKNSAHHPSKDALKKYEF